MSRDGRGDRDDEDRDAILARRALFIASAVAGLSLSGCEPQPAPEPCLNVAIPPPPGDDDGTEGDDGQAGASAGDASAPEAGADAGAEPVDAGSRGSEPDDAGSSSPWGDAGAPAVCLRIAPPPDGGPVPRPCLSPRPPPRPCLKVAPRPGTELDPSLVAPPSARPGDGGDDEEPV